MKDSKFQQERRILMDEREEQKRRIASLEADGMKKAKAIADAAERYYTEIKAEIAQLIDKKLEILRSPRTPEETAELAKKQLAELKRTVLLDELLYPHLKQVQEQGGYPFERPAMRVHFMSDMNAWRFGYIAFTEEDIDEVCRRLPQIGMSTDQKLNEVAEIDKRISELEEKLKKDPPQQVLLGGA